MYYLVKRNKDNIMDNTLKVELGKKLRERREQLHLTQRQVAEVLKVSQPVYQRFERGIFECSYAQLVALCKLYDLSADYLLGLRDY